jgi:hypothetical protein
MYAAVIDVLFQMPVLCAWYSFGMVQLLLMPSFNYSKYPNNSNNPNISSVSLVWSLTLLKTFIQALIIVNLYTLYPCFVVEIDGYKLRNFKACINVCNGFNSEMFGLQVVREASCSSLIVYYL